MKTGTGEEKVMKSDHVVFALGFGGGVANVPKFPGRVSSFCFLRFFVFAIL